MKLHGMMRTPEKELMKLDKSEPMLGDFMICMETYMNGAGIGMDIIPVDLLRIQ